jgi:two-component system, NarL family, response regulator NreC
MESSSAQAPEQRPPVQPRDNAAQRPETLTPSEIEVLKYIAEGQSTKQLAATLGITFKTACCHRQRVMDKLDIHNTATLVRYTIRSGIVTA